MNLEQRLHDTVKKIQKHYLLGLQVIAFMDLGLIRKPMCQNQGLYIVFLNLSSEFHLSIRWFSRVPNNVVIFFPECFSG